jgi:hypothetical protein
LNIILHSPFPIGEKGEKMNTGLFPGALTKPPGRLNNYLFPVPPDERKQYPSHSGGFEIS